MKIEKFPAICRFTFGRMSDYDKKYYEKYPYTIRAFEKYPRIYDNRRNFRTYVIKEGSLLVVIGKLELRYRRNYSYRVVPLQALLDEYTPVRAINRWTSALKWVPGLPENDLKPLFDEE